MYFVETDGHVIGPFKTHAQVLRWIKDAKLKEGEATYGLLWEPRAYADLIGMTTTTGFSKTLRQSAPAPNSPNSTTNSTGKK